MGAYAQLASNLGAACAAGLAAQLAAWVGLESERWECNGKGWGALPAGRPGLSRRSAVGLGGALEQKWPVPAGQQKGAKRSRQGWVLTPSWRATSGRHAQRAGLVGLESERGKCNGKGWGALPAGQPVSVAEMRTRATGRSTDGAGQDEGAGWDWVCGCPRWPVVAMA